MAKPGHVHKEFQLLVINTGLIFVQRIYNKKNYLIDYYWLLTTPDRHPTDINHVFPHPLHKTVSIKKKVKCVPF